MRESIGLIEDSFLKSFFMNLAISTIVVGATLLAPTVSAGPLEQKLKLDFKTSNHSSLFPAGSDSMSINYNNGTATENSTVAAGMFSGTSVEGPDTTIDTTTLFKDASNVFAYCIDIMKELQSLAVYQIQSIQQNQVEDGSGVRRDFGRMLTFLGAVNTVLQKDVDSGGFGFSPDSKNWLRPSTGWMSGAIQLGIWESLYEAEDARLSVRQGDNDKGWFWAGTNVNTEGLSFLDTAFGLINDPEIAVTAVSASEVLWAVNADGQDVLIDPVDVPVPATGFLLLAGLGAFTWRRRLRA